MKNTMIFPATKNWIVGENGVVALLTETLERIPNAILPEMNEFVEVFMHSGNTFCARRIAGFEPGCGWIWETPTGWLVPGHPLLKCWRPLNLEYSTTSARSVNQLSLFKDL